MEWVSAILYQPDGDRLRCTLCPFRCALRDGQAGPCGVRRRNGDRMETATFAATVVHLDAIERKPLYHFRPGSRVLTLGAPGCTFRCDYCVNHRLSQYGRDPAVPWDAHPVDPEDVVGRAVHADAGIALSYSEPSLAIELTVELARHAGPLGVPVVWKSNGFLTPEAADLAAGHLDAVNVDVKAADETRHRRLTGAPLAPVLETLRILRERGVWVEVSTPLIPGVSADPGSLARIAGLVAAIDPGIPWHLLRFTPTYRMAGTAPTLPAALAAAVREGRAAGLRHVYVERALGPGGRETRCPACATIVVTRGTWSAETVRLVDGRCPSCGSAVEGRWS